MKNKERKKERKKERNKKKEIEMKEKEKKERKTIWEKKVKYVPNLNLMTSVVARE